MKNFRLRRELRSNRVEDTEIDALLDIANQLKSVEQPKLSQTARQRIEAQTHKPMRTPRVVMWSLAGGLATVTLVITSAQFAPKNSPLYTIKQGTDKIRSLFQPEQNQQTPEAINREHIDKIELRSPEPIAESPKLAPPPQSSNDRSPEHKQDSDRRSSNHDNRRDFRDHYDKDRNEPKPFQRIQNDLRSLFRGW